MILYYFVHDDFDLFDNKILIFELLKFCVKRFQDFYSEVYSGYVKGEKKKVCKLI